MLLWVAISIVLLTHSLIGKPRKSVVASIGCIQIQLDLVDIWNVKNPSTKSYTWSQKSPNIFCRLDYWFYNNKGQNY